MSIAIIFIGTEKYFKFFEKYYATISDKFLPNTEKNFYVFTDINFKSEKNIFVYPIEHREWPFVTLLRFNSMLPALTKIITNEWFIYLDADMYINRVIMESEFFCHNKNLFGVQHPGYINKMGTFEDNFKSCAYISPFEDKSIYWQGCLWGGKIKPAIDMILELNRRITVDLSKSIIAKWHDESHLNKYFIEHKDNIYTYDCGYCFPEEYVELNLLSEIDKKIIHMNKPKSIFQRFEGGKII